METVKDKLGKVSITVDKNYWDISKDYNKLTIVEDSESQSCYLSRKLVPAGTNILNRNYWIRLSIKDNTGGGISQYFGDRTDVSISQKVITEYKDNIAETINNQIETVQKEIIGEASDDYNDLGKLENKLIEEISRAESSERLIQEQYNALTQSGVTIINSSDWPISNPQKQVIYRVTGTTSYTDYMWDGSNFISMATYNNGIDNEPTIGSENIVKSDGIMRMAKGLYIPVNGIVYFDTANQTITFKAGTTINNTTLSDDIIYSATEANDIAKNKVLNYNWYLIFDTNTSEKRYISSNQVNFNLNENEVLLCYILFNEEVRHHNFSRLCTNNYPIFNAVSQEFLTNSFAVNLNKTGINYIFKQPRKIKNNTEYYKLPFAIPANTILKIKIIEVDADSEYEYLNLYGKTYYASDYFQVCQFLTSTSIYEMQVITTAEIRYIRLLKGNVTMSYTLQFSYGGEDYDTLKNDVIENKLITDKLANIASVTKNSTTYNSESLVDGYYSTTTTFKVSTTIKCTKIKVSKGDIIKLSTVGERLARALIIDTSELFIADPYTIYTNFIKQIEGDGYIYVNCTNNGLDKFSLAIETFVSKESEQTAGGVPCMFNPPVNLFKDNLRILDIGNSYTANATSYLSNIITATNITQDFSLYIANRSSGSFKTWVDTYNDQDTKSYNVEKIAGTTIDNVAGNGDAGNGDIFRNALSTGWDIIVIHQVSTYSNNYDLWNSNNNSGYLKEFIRIIRKTNPGASIGFLLVHTYRGSYSGNTEGSSKQRWVNIAESTKKLRLNYGIDFIIPYGTAVQNLRETTLNDDNEFSTDGTHLANGIGKYVASCCYYQSIFAPRTGINILGNTWRKEDYDENQDGVKNINDANAVLAQKAAFIACYDQYNINNPENIEL